MTIPQLAEASPGPTFLPASADTGRPLIKGSECRHLPDGSAVRMVKDSSGKKLRSTFPAQTRWGNRWQGAPWQDDRLDDKATYVLLSPDLVDLWLLHQEAN